MSLADEENVQPLLSEEREGGEEREERTAPPHVQDDPDVDPARDPLGPDVPSEEAEPLLPPVSPPPLPEEADTPQEPPDPEE